MPMNYIFHQIKFHYHNTFERYILIYYQEKDQGINLISTLFNIVTFCENLQYTYSSSPNNEEKSNTNSPKLPSNCNVSKHIFKNNLIFNYNIMFISNQKTYIICTLLNNSQILLSFYFILSYITSTFQRNISLSKTEQYRVMIQNHFSSHYNGVFIYKFSEKLLLELIKHSCVKWSSKIVINSVLIL